MIQRYITNDDKKYLKMHQAIEKQYSYIKYYYIKSYDLCYCVEFLRKLFSEGLD
jgi:hypothetical protein